MNNGNNLNYEFLPWQFWQLKFIIDLNLLSCSHRSKLNKLVFTYNGPTFWLFLVFKNCLSRQGNFDSNVWNVCSKWYAYTEQVCTHARKGSPTRHSCSIWEREEMFIFIHKHKVYIYSWLSRIFTARGSVKGEPTKGINHFAQPISFHITVYIMA